MDVATSDTAQSWDSPPASHRSFFCLDDKKLDISYLPLERIHFASVATFENIIKILLAGGNLPAIFNQVIAGNKEPQKKKYLLDMHLSAYEGTDISLLESIFDDLCAELENRVKK